MYGYGLYYPECECVGSVSPKIVGHFKGPPKAPPSPILGGHFRKLSAKIYGTFSVVIRQAPHCPSQRHHPLSLQVTPLWYDPSWGRVGN